ncbi:MAG: HD domain-containing protein [Promethearchaeota archaeon]
MSESKLILKIRNFAEKNSERDDIHGFAHVERVYNICVQIGKKLGANLLVLKISALLHDVGRILEKNYSEIRNHAEISALMSLKFLKSNDFKLSQEDIDNIIHSIKAHSFSNKTKPQTLEAKILSDADKLDAIGAIGLYRTIGFTVKNNGGIRQVIKHLENKIMKLKDKMFLDVSKKIAENRQQIILDFYNRIIMEI